MLTKKRGGTRKKERCSKYASFCGGGDLLKALGSMALFLANGILYRTNDKMAHFCTNPCIIPITDELAQPQRIARVLTAGTSFGLVGRVTGMVAFGVLGWATSLATAMVGSGVGMALLALFVAAQFTERTFIPRREKRGHASLSVVRLVISLLRRDHEILLVRGATMLINAALMAAWLFPRQLIHLGFPSDPVLWYTAVGICSLAAGFIALRLVQARIDGVGVARRMYALACFIGVLGLLVLASAPDALIGGVGVLLVSGITVNVTRTVSVIWVKSCRHAEMRDVSTATGDHWRHLSIRRWRSCS